MPKGEEMLALHKIVGHCVACNAPVNVKGGFVLPRMPGTVTMHEWQEHAAQMEEEQRAAMVKPVERRGRQNGQSPYRNGVSKS